MVVKENAQFTIQPSEKARQFPNFQICIFILNLFTFQWILEFLGVGEFLPSNGFMDWIAGFFCDEGVLQGVCSNVIFVVAGYNEAQVNTTQLETIMKHTPAGTSSNTLVQFGQEINSSKCNV